MVNKLLRVLCILLVVVRLRMLLAGQYPIVMLLTGKYIEALVSFVQIRVISAYQSHSKNFNDEKSPINTIEESINKYDLLTHSYLCLKLDDKIVISYARD